MGEGMDYQLDILPDNEESIEREIRNLKDENLDCFKALYGALRLLTGDEENPGVGVGRSERLETLVVEVSEGIKRDIDTYAYPLWCSKKGLKMIITRQVDTNRYIFIGLVQIPNSNEITDIVYELACQAHGFECHDRIKNEDR